MVRERDAELIASGRLGIPFGGAWRIVDAIRACNSRKESCLNSSIWVFCFAE